MFRSFVFINLLLVSAFSFAQQNTAVKVIGRLPGAESCELYQIQVGAFRQSGNAQSAYERLAGASLRPEYEQFRDFTRVKVMGISATDVPVAIERIKNAGFTEIIIRFDTVSTSAVRLAAELPVSTVTVPVPATNANEESAASVENMASLPPPESKTGDSPKSNLTEYQTDPEFSLSYRFNNKGEIKGNSGPNGGIDILGKAANNEWLWTTNNQGGWFYNLNGVMREMTNGFQRGNNGVTLTVKPEFVYDNGVPCLQLTHILHNTGRFAATDQKFGASADVMINDNDWASLELTEYGVYMTDSKDNPSLELMFVCLSEDGIDPVDTLWLGMWNGGTHLNNIYNDSRADINNADSAIGFSYQNIDLEPGESKEFTVRFTLASHEQ
jgi:hypothetical protein